MRQGLVIGFIVSSLIVSGAVALVRPLGPFPTNLSSGSEVPFQCENRSEGDRVEIREESAGQRIEIRVEADTRLRAEARFEMSWDARREAGLELCGFVQFIDSNSDGRLDPTDKIVSSDLARFGPIDHTRIADAHVFETVTATGDLAVNLTIPASFPAPDVPLIRWMATAHLRCETNATHFAILAEQDEPSQFRRFFAAPCGTTLVASDRTSPEAPAAAPFECRDLVPGKAFEVSLAEQDGGVQRLQARVEAGTRVRTEVRFETGDTEWDVRAQRESRLEICGFLQFVDKDGDGRFGPSDTVISTTLVAFANLTHAIEGTMHVFLAEATRGNLTVMIRIPATFPAVGDPLIRWAVAANPTCDAESTHYAVKLRQEASMQSEEFLVAACGASLSEMGEA